MQRPTPLPNGLPFPLPKLHQDAKKMCFLPPPCGYQFLPQKKLVLIAKLVRFVSVEFLFFRITKRKIVSFHGARYVVAGPRKLKVGRESVWRSEAQEAPPLLDRGGGWRGQGRPQAFTGIASVAATAGLRSMFSMRSRAAAVTSGRREERVPGVRGRVWRWVPGTDAVHARTGMPTDGQTNGPGGPAPPGRHFDPSDQALMTG
jgi:hypothetical protein